MSGPAPTEPVAKDRPRVRLALGLMLIAASGADGFELLARPGGPADWLLVGRMDLTFLCGLRLLGGPLSRSLRLALRTALLGLTAFDAARVVLGLPQRPIFARVVPNPGWTLAGDLLVLAAWRGWRFPAARRGVDERPMPARRVAALTIVGLVLGVGIEGSQLGRYPVVGRVTTTDPSPAGLRYLAYLPRGYYTTVRAWPLILVLHGAGPVGDDLGLVQRDGLPWRLEKGAAVPFVVVAPQSPRFGWDIPALVALLDEVLTLYRVDPNRVYLTGDSMGGNGVWALATAHPRRFAAIAPLCGGGDPDRAGRLRDIAAWVFHGADDPVIAPEESLAMVEALKAAGGAVRMTLYRGRGHDVRSPTYDDGILYDWFLTHVRRP